MSHHLPKQDQHKEKIPISASIDMGWNTRSSGSKYAGLSGASIMIGQQSRKSVEYEIKSKDCTVCSTNKKINKPIPKHDFPKNFVGLSKLMAPKAALDMVVRLWEKGCAIPFLVGNDDSSTKAILTHQRKNSKRECDRVKLPDEIAEPKWLADPQHCM